MLSTALTNPTTLTQLELIFEKYRQQYRAKQPALAAWYDTHKIKLGDLAKASQQFVAAAAIAGSLLMKQTVDAQVAERLRAEATQAAHQEQLLAQVRAEEQQVVVEKMQTLVKQAPGHLAKEDELYLEQQLSDMLGFQVTAELEGHRLNHSIGIMGGEQHLRRFPNDTLDQHDAYRESGMAPNRGAFGWFTEGGQLTEEAIQREKYYFAVQTLYLPDWNSNHAELKPWYKFRKMVAVNPADKVAVVGVVGDAGPAMWVQKQYGGSPEIIREGKIWSKEARGRVILFFVDDPENKVPLGPISLDTATQLAQGITNE